MNDLKNKGMGTIAIHAGQGKIHLELYQLQYIKHQHLCLILQNREEQDLLEKKKGIFTQD